MVLRCNRDLLSLSWSSWIACSAMPLKNYVLVLTQQYNMSCLFTICLTRVNKSVIRKIAIITVVLLNVDRVPCFKFLKYFLGFRDISGRWLSDGSANSRGRRCNPQLLFQPCIVAFSFLLSLVINSFQKDCS